MNKNLAAALADTSKLEPFEGVDVLGAGIEIPGAAGGLRDAMKIEPRQFHGGDRLYVVLECDVSKVRFDPIASDGEMLGWRRVHVLAAQAATFVDGDLVKEAIDSQKRKIQLAAESAAGIGRLTYGDDDVAETVTAHDEGLHAAGLVPGCPKCDAETVEELAETEPPPPPPTPLSGRRSRKANGG
jgi:hypothetical protein